MRFLRLLGEIVQPIEEEFVATTEETNLEIVGLLKTNMRFGEEERSGPRGRSFFEKALDDNLCFRRGNGSIATKQDFLDGLEDPDNRRAGFRRSSSAVQGPSWRRRR